MGLPHLDKLRWRRHTLTSRHCKLPDPQMIPSVVVSLAHEIGQDEWDLAPSYLALSSHERR